VIFLASFVFNICFGIIIIIIIIVVIIIIIIIIASLNYSKLQLDLFGISE